MARVFKVLAVGDAHCPWMLYRTLDGICAAARGLKPDIIIQLGDLYDFFSWTRFPRTYNLLTPIEEAKQGRKMAENMWARLAKAAPKAKLYQLRGNHDDRPYKRILEAAAEFEDLLKLDPLFQFDGVETQPSSRDELIIQGVCYMHGFRSKLGDHARHNRMSTVCGHSHKGGVVTMRLGKKTLFECNAGFLGNPNSRPLSYGAQRKFNDQTQGFAFIDSLGPRFVPLPNP
ncbi:MAG: metallophosphoesterase [Pseudomonadota bacterium]